MDLENRCEIKTLHKLGYSNWYIARYLNCSPTTMANELKRGTKTKVSLLGRPSEYSPRRSEKLYKVNKGKCGRKPKLHNRLPFVQWVCEKAKKDKWSLDACVGYAKHTGLFNGFNVCTKTLYNSLHQGVLGLSLFDVPEVLSRRKRRTFSTPS